MATSIQKPQVIASPFCGSGDKNVIPATATGTNLASIEEGFPPITSKPLNEGGIPPERKDFNGILNLDSQFYFAFQNGWRPTFDADVSTAIGGYAAGAVLWNDASNCFVKSLKNNNTDNFVTDPSKIDGVSWIALAAGEYHPPLFAPGWFDYQPNMMSWLRADTFSWQDGTVYSVAYSHLVSDISGVTASTETISGTTITYYQAADGHKIVLADQETNVSTIYTATGVAWYYILDTNNTRFKLPRTKYAFTGLRDTVGNYVEAGLPNITGSVSEQNIETHTLTGAFSKGGSYSNGAFTSGANNLRTLYFDASSSNSIYGNSTTVQPPATQMYLYFYVGQFTQSATEQTAGLNAELFNTKVDLNAANLSNQGTSKIANLAMPSSTYEDLTVGVSGTEYTAPADGYVFMNVGLSGTSGYATLYVTGLYSVTAIPVSNLSSSSVIYPVKKGRTFKLDYSTYATFNSFRFIYAVGSEWEKQ